VGQAIASFERAIVSGPAPYDYYQQLQKFSGLDPDDLKSDDPDQYKQYVKAKADAEAHPLSESALRGMKIYFGTKGKCSACHVGPNLADEKYHNLGIGMDAKKPDLGRFEETKQESDKGAFKTPTVRNVAQSAPYMHDGSLKTLEEVIDWYDKGGLANPHLDKDVKKLDLSKTDKEDLLAFLKEGCTGDFPKIERGRLPQ
jgi:cytochrome c peroxidase